MTATRSRPLRADTDAETGSADGRRIRPRRGLPGGRAVIGGLLVAVAAVGTFAAVSGAGRGPDTRYVAASRDLTAGEVLEAGDLEEVAIDLPAAQADRVFSDPDALLGAVVVGPISAGELIQAGGLADGADAEIPTFSIAIDSADANAGRLSRGDFVHVLATYGDGPSAETLTLSSEARVIEVADESDSIASSGQAVIRLQVPAPRERLAIVNALVSARLTLVRVSGAEEVGDPDATFRPDRDLGIDEDAVTTTTTGDTDEDDG